MVGRGFQAFLADDGWPPSEELTGLFAAGIQDLAGTSLVLCCDVIGAEALYFVEVDEGVAASTSLTVLAEAFGLAVDEAGLAETASPPYVTYGRRTLAKGAKRLLPGERRRYWRDGRIAIDFDNSLCARLESGKREDLAAAYWERFVDEVRLATHGAAVRHVAMSAGMDSRLCLAAGMMLGGRLKCHTYGDENLNEVRIAKECARLSGADFQNYPIQGRYFPPAVRFRELVAETEDFKFLVWNAVLELCRAAPAEPILVGDLCESAAGRNIDRKANRRKRTRLALKRICGLKPAFSPSSKESLKCWAEEIRSEILNSISGTLREVCTTQPMNVLLAEIEEDIEISIQRVLSHQPPFVEQCDEVFKWFHKGRILMYSQVNALRAVFGAVCPAMGIQCMRFISRIGPEHRMMRRFMDEIARQGVLSGLQRLPTAQVPWAGADAPSLMLDALWYLRSTFDQHLTRRMLRRRDPTARQRLVPALNYIPEYRNADLLQVRGWFDEKWIRPEAYLKRVEARANLAQWPLINLDVAAPACASVLAGLIAK